MSDYNPSHKPQLYLYIFECVMSVAYLGIAYILLATNIFTETMSTGIRVGLGIVFIVYGIFRVIRVVRKGRKKS